MHVDAKVKLKVQGLTNSQVQSGAYALILSEEKGLRRIPIIVGMAEAQSIAIALEHIIAPRPLTHDLFTAIFQAYHIRLLEVYIYKFEEGVFFSELLLEKRGGEKVRIDSRTSDAIAIALRVNCDIYTSEQIVQECGVVLEEASSDEEKDDDDDLLYLEPEEIKDDAKLKKKLSFMDIEDLNMRLENAINQENYEQAKMYRDELRRREE
ncbi:hypothetical protein AGMMS49574_16660 [Bacteroidia bacterium]|nr:hypothetical protein AGMMS49574_16660 [Bacteroidia bacterium]